MANPENKIPGAPGSSEKYVPGKDLLKDILIGRANKPSLPKWSSPLDDPSTTRPVEYAKQMAGAPMAPTGLPAPPPNQAAKVPPAWQRYSTALKMQQGFANNWSPHPILTRILEGT